MRKGMIRTCELSYQVFRVLSKTHCFYLIEKKPCFFSNSLDLFEINYKSNIRVRSCCCCLGCERSIIRTIVHVDRFRYSKKSKSYDFYDRRALKKKKRKEKKRFERCYRAYWPRGCLHTIHRIDLDPAYRSFIGAR